MEKLTGTKRRLNNIAKNVQESRSSNMSWQKKKKKWPGSLTGTLLMKEMIGSLVNLSKV